MIRVTVELVSARTGRTSVLGRATIVNDGSGDARSGNYDAHFFDKAGRAWRSARVEGFPRRRLLAWDLVCRALAAAAGERNRG